VRRLGALAALAIVAGAFALAEPASELGAEPVIVVLGEMHDNPDHHVVQAQWLMRYPPAAAVFEMLTPAQVAAGGGIDRDDAAALGRAYGWEAAGWPDFAIYAPVFAALPEVPLYGAALPRDAVRAAAQVGAAAVFGDGADSFGLGPLAQADQAAREAEQMEVHCDALPAAMMAGMVEVQRLRDAHFARVALQALDETGGPVVVITGNGHARRDRGIPAAIALARPGVEVFALGQFEAPPEGDVPYDGYFIAAPIDRGDPCAAFR